jgi:hypothetical protein
MAPPPEMPPSSTGGASRSRQSGGVASTIAPTLEERHIVVAQGVEAQNSNLSTDERLPDGLQLLLPDLDITSATTATYLSQTQGVRYFIRIITQKDQYKTALETAGLHVVYAGHARYGRGPCFGDSTNPGEWWGDGTNATDGLFRMGYPYISVPTSDIMRHEYLTWPAPTNTSKPLRRSCHPDIRARYGSVREYSFEQELTNYCVTTGSGNTYWGFNKFEDGHRKRYIILLADWQNTSTTPADLGATNLQCRVFCHFGCSTFKHNYRILRFRKNWQRTETDRFAYWTTSSSYPATTRRWLYRILTYPQFNAFQSWRPSLRYAVRMTNRDLRSEGYRYRII